MKQIRRIVLSVDGGGIRGVLPAMLLYRAAQEIGESARSIFDCFDLVAGTSTGGIIATGIYAGVDPGKILDLYISEGPAIFSRSPWQFVRSGFGRFGPASKYRAAALSSALSAAFRGKRLWQQFGKTRLLVPSYCIRLPKPIDMDNDGVAECASALFFKSVDARRDALNSDFSLVDVCRATSAAPTYFPAAKILNGAGAEYLCIDGGVFANNPAMCAWAQARKYWPLDDITVVSIGTGSRVRSISGSGDWGPPQWLPKIFGAFMDGAADSVSYQARAILGPKFYRFEQPLIGVREAFDDATRGNIEALKELAVRFANRNLHGLMAAIRG